MLFAVKYLCDECKHEQVIRFLKIKVPDWSASPQYIICSQCKSKKMERLFSGGTFRIEECEGGESSKSDSYWANAEYLRQKKLKKGLERAKEQSFYGEHKYKSKHGVATNRMPDQKDVN